MDENLPSFDDLLQEASQNGLIVNQRVVGQLANTPQEVERSFIRHLSSFATSYNFVNICG